jgi:hypothetical protein
MAADDDFSSMKMGDLIQSVQETLKKSIESISSVNIDLKVLAINAKIQAARVGSIGAGFSVVADEMERLSSHTQDIIEGLDTEVGNAVQGLIDVENQTRGHRLAQIASTCIDLVDRNLYERSCDVRWWAAGRSVVEAAVDQTPSVLDHASRRLATILESYTVYFDLLVCDLNGNILCNGRPQQYPCKGLNIGQRNWFIQALKNTSGSDYGFEGPISSDLVKKQNILVYSCGIREGGQSNGKLIGVLAVIFDWNGLSNDLLNQAETILRTETAKPVHGFLCQSDGTVISATSTEWIGKKLPFDDLNQISLGADSYKEQKDANGDSTLIGVAASRGFETYKSGWFSVIIESSSFG